MGGFKSQQFNVSSPSSSLGKLGERVALAAYIKRGFAVVGSNMVNTQGKRLGELDLVVKNKDTIIFVEVKTRSATVSRFGLARESISPYKAHRIVKTVKLFLMRNPQYRNLRPQIDVCLVNPRNPDNRRIPDNRQFLDNRQFSVTILANAVPDEF